MATATVTQLHPQRELTDLTFVKSDGATRPFFWSTPKLKTDEWSVHEEVGRSFGHEFLELLKEGNLNAKAFSWIATDISLSGADNDGMLIGFFDVISEHLVTGGALR